MIELDVRERNTPQFGIISNQNLEDMEMNLKDMLPNIFGGGTKKRKMRVADAFDYLVQEEEGRLIDMDQVNRVATERVESSGIILLDEIDKIAGAAKAAHGPDRFSGKACSATSFRSSKAPPSTRATAWCVPITSCSLLPAPSMSRKPSDLIPGVARAAFPLRVELKSLTVEDFLRILTEPEVVADQAVHGAAGDRGRDVWPSRPRLCARWPHSPFA